MKKGIIYSVVDYLIEKLYYLNLVELFKFIAVKISPNNRITASRFSVDIFILLKWLFIALFWHFNVKNDFINLIVWYLIFTNVYTYFYYHIWRKNIDKSEFDRIKRRFLNLGLSIAFNVLSFAYLFAQPFSNNYKWNNGYSTFQDSILFSLANSFTTSYNSVQSITKIGHKISLLETVISFVFLTIILSNSIPQVKTDKMAYKNKIYVCFDADKDIRYYNLMKAWEKNKNIAFNFHNAHDINNLEDKSSEEQIKRKLRKRLENTKVLVVLIGNSTKNLYKYVRWEIEFAIEEDIPIIAVNLNKKNRKDSLCPPILKNELAIFVPFCQKKINCALNDWPLKHIEHRKNNNSISSYLS